MGTCHVLMHKKLIERITAPPYDVVVTVLGMIDYGEDGLFQVHIETDILPEGYHGQQEIVVTEDGVELKRDYDT